MRATSLPVTSRPPSRSEAVARVLRTSTIWLVIAALAVVMSLVAPNFLTVTNLRTVIVNMTHVAILAFGLTFVFLGGGFDLSQGAILILAATVLVGINPEPLPLMIGTFLLILGMSAGIGTINGYLIGIQRLNPFVVTLGTRTVIGSIVFINAASAVYGMARQAPILEFIGLGKLFKFLPVLTVAASRALIEQGVATGGMQAKLNAALEALGRGVGQVVIAPGAEPGVVGRLLAGESLGTRLVREGGPNE